MADAFENFIDPMQAVFSDPPTAALREKGDAAGYYAALGLALSDFTAEAMREAAGILIAAPRDKKEGRWFPAIAECIAACGKATSDIAARKKAALREAQMADQKKSNPWSDYAISQAERLISNHKDLSRRAAKEGWIIGLWDHFRENNYTPSQAQIVEMISNARDIERQHRMLAAVERPTATTIGMMRMYRAREARIKRLGQLVA